MQQHRPGPDPAAPPTQAAPSLAVIRLLLGVFGLILIAGFVYVAAELYRRASDPDYRAVVEYGGPLEPVHLSLDGPADGHIESLLAVGGRLVIRVVSDQSADDRLYVFDPLRGRITATLDVNRAGPGSEGAAEAAAIRRSLSDGAHQTNATEAPASSTRSPQ